MSVEKISVGNVCNWLDVPPRSSYGKGSKYVINNYMAILFRESALFLFNGWFRPYYLIVSVGRPYISTSTKVPTFLSDKNWPDITYKKIINLFYKESDRKR